MDRPEHTPSVPPPPLAADTAQILEAGRDNEVKTHQKTKTHHVETVKLESVRGITPHIKLEQVAKHRLNWNLWKRNVQRLSLL